MPRGFEPGLLGLRVESVSARPFGSDLCEFCFLLEKVSEILMELKKASKLRFDWVNSPLLDAYINGKWLLVEDVNCCR